MDMHAEIWALLAALCWAGGSMLEKRGVGLGGFSPVMGAAIRTIVSLALLLVISHPFWGQVRDSGPKPILLVALGGGILSGGLGIIFLYTGLKSGNISTVMTIAFCFAPVIGTVLGYFILKERISPVQLAGIILCVTGAAMTVYFRKP